MERFEIDELEPLLGKPYKQLKIYLHNEIEALFSEIPQRIKLLFVADKPLKEFSPTEVMVNDLDEKSFGFEDKGNPSKSTDYFVAARFVSAHLGYLNAVNETDLLNAAYEIHHCRLSLG